MLCSLRYNLRFPGEAVPTGVYDIVANVSKKRSWKHACKISV